MEMHFELMMYGVIAITFFISILCGVILHKEWIQEGDPIGVWGTIFTIFILGSFFSGLIYWGVSALHG
jgi:hypothetical protein